MRENKRQYIFFHANVWCLAVRSVQIRLYIIKTCLSVLNARARKCVYVYVKPEPQKILSGRLVSCFWFNGPFGQYNSLYRAVSQREGEREEKREESKNVQTTPPYCKRNRPLHYYHPNCRTPRYWKFTQDHRTTRPPQILFENKKITV